MLAWRVGRRQLWLDAPCGRDAVARPPVITALAAVLAAAPVFQLLSLAGLHLLNFAPEHLWNYVAYCLAAPWVARLLWCRHPRARFAAYVFFTHETVRGLHFRHWDAVLVAGAWTLLLQLPSVRRYAPSVRPDEMRARLRWLAGEPRESGGPPPSGG